MGALSSGFDARPVSGSGPASPSRASGQFLNPTRMARLVALALGGLTSLAQASGWTVGGGTLTVNGGIDGDIVVASGATLAGGGAIGSLTLADGAILAPNPASGFNVAGTVNLGGTLSLSLASAPAADTVYTLVNNDGSDAASGTFAGLAEGATYTVGATSFRVSYAGGDGNDVTLIALAAATTPAPVYTPPAPPDVPVSPGGTTTVTGATTVTASEGGTIVIPAGTASIGATIALPTPPTGGTAPAPVTIAVGGQNLTVIPNAPGTILLVQTAIVNGVSTQVLSVSSGSIAVTASQPGQPLLAVGSGSSTVVITAGAAGTAATTAVNAGTGETLIAVSSGVVTLPANAFASTTGFAAIKDGKVYAGEVATFNPAGKITGVRLGSLDGTSGQLGDPLGPVNATSTTAKVKLQGKAARDPSGHDLADSLANALGQGYTSEGQNADGVLRVKFAGGTLNALPLGTLAIDTDRPDGVVIRTDGMAEVSVSGIVATFAPALPSVSDLLGVLPPGSTAQISAEGVITVTYQGTRYWLRPDWNATPGGAAGLSQGQTTVTFGDGKDSYTLLPSFANYAALREVVAMEIPDATFQANPDGSVSLGVAGETHILTPRMQEKRMDEETFNRVMNGKRWWQDAAGRLFLNAGGAVQEFEVR